MSVNEEENWLHSERIECSSCHQWLYRVDHSPFIDAYYLYCNRCPIRVDISYYDPTFAHIEKQVRQTAEAEQGGRYVLLMRAIEVHLKPCLCGGRFCSDAPRRCFTCHTPVISENPDGVDLYPEWMDFSLPDVSVEQEGQWTAQFFRTEDIWQDPHP